MLWHEYPEELDSQTLKEAYQMIEGDPPSDIPLIVRLLENPSSPFALPGAIDLYGHDCIHLLLKQGFTQTNEAYVLGFTMGNDVRTQNIHLLIFKFAIKYLYPTKYRFGDSDFSVFRQGFELGRKLRIKNLNQFIFQRLQDKTLTAIREELGLAA